MTRVFYNFSNKISTETFEYDDADRVTNDHCVYNQLAVNSVTSEIEYATNEDSPLADGRVNTYTYKVNGSTKAQTSNTYDSYKRIQKKEYKINKNYFLKEIEYNTRQQIKIFDKKKVLMSGYDDLSNDEYNYDAMGRIKSII